MIPSVASKLEPASVHILQTLEPILRLEIGRGCPDFLRSQTDDLVQSGMIRLVRALERDQVIKKAYVKQVAWSVTVDAIRKSRRTADQPTPEGADALDRLAGGRSPEERAALGELRQALRDCLGALTVATKDVITLYLMGHTIPESSDLLSVTYKQAENRIYRGLDAMRKCLEKKGVRP